MNPWTLYDELIDLIPADVRTTNCLLNRVAFVAHEAGGCGIAARDHGGGKAIDPSIIGKSLRDVAALSKSWDFAHASLGVAAINSWLNTRHRLENSGLQVDTYDRDVFDARAGNLKGQKVAMIGHFPGGIDALAGAEVTVLERSPRPGDLPDPACEYVVPHADTVFITGMSIANKTLPRLLELSRNADVILVGASVPFAPEVFTSQELATSYVSDQEGAAASIGLGASLPQIQPFTHRFTALPQSTRKV
ncbi:MAG: Rossmann-like domain-containing protein [Ancrocorticia sp.]|uniref:Rossmann-like domain-containing protein n=1 Tax=Ancrocorticia sp. TaxID=2593684 RepID=UPI003F8DD574